MKRFILVGLLGLAMTSCMTAQDKLVWQEFKTQTFEKPENPSLIGEQPKVEEQVQSKNDQATEAAR